MMAVVRMLWLASPALPIGAYAYSRGLEAAVTAGWVSSEAELLGWLMGVLERQVGTLDAPVLARLYDAFRSGDDASVARWDGFLCASRDTAELALEDRQLGLSLSRLLVDAGVTAASAFRERGAYATLFALACVHFGVARRDAVSAYLFAFAEGQVTAGSKLIPLGQRAAQRVLEALLARIDALAERALGLGDAELGSFTPFVSLGSALHETQYARLYRS